MKLPICDDDAKNACLCPRCEGKINVGEICQADVDASVILADVARSDRHVRKFTLFSCREFDGDYLLLLARDDIAVIRRSRTLYTALQNKFGSRIWLVEEGQSDMGFIEDLFFPVKILTVNTVWAPGGCKKARVVITGKWSPKFPVSIEGAIKVVKGVLNLDIEIEFEYGRMKVWEKTI